MSYLKETEGGIFDLACPIPTLRVCLLITELTRKVQEQQQCFCIAAALTILLWMSSSEKNYVELTPIYADFASYLAISVTSSNQAEEMHFVENC